jgi:hypothetical protein
MKRTIMAMLCMVPLCAHAQQQPPPSASATFTGQMASLLATTLDERDSCRAQLAAAKPQAPLATPPTPAPESKP